jgi:hypothetical protein
VARRPGARRALPDRRGRVSRARLGARTRVRIEPGPPVCGAPPSRQWRAPVAAIAAAALVFAAFARAETAAGEGLVAQVVDGWRRLADLWRTVALAAAAAAAAYAASLGILELAQAGWGGTTEHAFNRGHVLVTGVWALAGCVGAVIFLRRGAWIAVAIAYGWLALTLFKTLVFDATQLEPDLRAAAFLAVATALLVAGLAIQLVLPGRLNPVGAPAILVSLGLALSAATTLFEGTWLGLDQDGVAVAAVALVFGVLAALAWPVPGQRDLRSLLAGVAVAVAAVADGILLAGVWLVLAWTVTAAALALLAVALAEPRRQLASVGYAAAADVATLGIEAPPTHLVVADEHPARGVVAVLLLIGALLALAWSSRRSAVDRVEQPALWIAGTLGVYAASLLILEAVVDLSIASVQTDFQRGHTAASALWAVLGLVCLYVGLVKRRRALRLGGLRSSASASASCSSTTWRR